MVFSILNILASVLGIQVGNAIANIRTGVVVVATALLGPLPGIIVGLIGSVYRDGQRSAVLQQLFSQVLSVPVSFLSFGRNTDA